VMCSAWRPRLPGRPRPFSSAPRSSPASPPRACFLSAGCVGGAAATRVGSSARTGNRRVDTGGDGQPPVPVGRRGVRELPDVVLAAHALQREPVSRLLVPGAAVRRRFRTPVPGDRVGPAFLAATLLVVAGIARCQRATRPGECEPEPSAPPASS
jgi:hypothetical protein